MQKARLFLLFSAAVWILMAPSGQSWAQTPAPPDRDRAGSDLVREEAASPTNAANVADRYRELVTLVRAMLQNHGPAREVLPPEDGKRIETMIRNGELEQAARAVSEAIRRLGNTKSAQNIPQQNLPPQNMPPQNTRVAQDPPRYQQVPAPRVISGN